MIKEISLTNFKCFEKEIKFNIGKITLLTGINGRGKSTVLQSILLLSQTFQKLKNPELLLINGKWIKLGNFNDIKNSNSDNDIITIQIKTEDPKDNEIKFEYSKYEKNERFASLSSLKVDGVDKFLEVSSNPTSNNEDTFTDSVKKTLSPLDDIKTLSLFNKFHYVAADRLGPINYFDKNNATEEAQVGIHGETLIDVLANHGEKDVSNHLTLGKRKGLLLEQTIRWLEYVLDGANISIYKEEKSSVLTMFLNSKSNEEFYKSINVGFGYSYILPLIVSGLLSEKGDVLVIENPEAHLHPRAQSRLIDFFVKVAETGVQIFIESHSEHVLNRLRLSGANKKIDFNFSDLEVYYFDDNYNSERLIINEKGEIDNWPVGFFDQQEIDLAELFKLSIQ